MNEEFKNEFEDVVDEQIEDIEENTDNFADDYVEPQKIEIVTPTNSIQPKTGREKGLRYFCLALAFVMLLSCFSIGGYYLGKVQNNTNDNAGQGNSSINITLDNSYVLFPASSGHCFKYIF